MPILKKKKNYKERHANLTEKQLQAKRKRDREYYKRKTNKEYGERLKIN